jgi:hypothetical protein
MHRNHVPIQVHVRKNECEPAASNRFHVFPRASKGGSGSMLKSIFCRISEEVICGLHRIGHYGCGGAMIVTRICQIGKIYQRHAATCAIV